MDSLSKLSDASYEETPGSEFEDELGRSVRSDFIEAENWKRAVGIETRLLRAVRMRRYQYDPEDAALIGGIDVYIGVAGLKCRSAESWINDILLNSLDKPWTIKPEPVPELPEWMKEQVVDALESELQQMGVSLDIRQRAKELKDAALQYAQKKAQDASDNMETLLDDQFTTGSWRHVFAQFITDLTTFPLAIIRDPVIEKKNSLSWTGDKVVESEETIYTSRRVSAFDIYPSMNSTTMQDGTFVIERFQAQPEFLYSCIGLEGFSEDAIREVLERYEDTGFQEQLTADYQRRYLEDKYNSSVDFDTIDALIRNGKLRGDKLLDYGIIVPDPQAYYESEVWTVNNRTIRAILNPYPLQARPLFATSFVKVPGSLWGEGLCDLLRDTQRMCNSAARSIVRNMSFSSGPLGEVDVSRLGEGEVPQELTPYKLFHVEADLSGNTAPAFRFTNIPSVAPMLMEVFDRYMKLADDLSGVPAYVLGNPQLAGAGRTMGGLSLMMANAAKGIKNVILNVDRDVTEPLVTLRYNMNMKFSDDPDIKGDAKIVARGATGLLQRELAQSKMTELMQTYLPFIQAGLIPANGAKIMIRESLKGTGLPVDEILPDPDPNDALATALGRIGAPPAVATPGMPPSPTLAPGALASPGPASLVNIPNPQPLDGRSVPPPFPQQGLPGPNPAGVPANIPQGLH